MEQTEAQQADFWSCNPCGADGDLIKVITQRYRIDSWLPLELQNIPTDRGKYLEVGCGQGVDGFYICGRLIKECEYTAIDFSTESVKRAAEFIDAAKEAFDIQVIPKFLWGDAMDLDFGDDEFDFIYSMGAIHHTPDPQKAIDEIHRVLKIGGQAKIFLYRRYSLKVGIAKILRGIQFIGDKLFFTDRFIYKFIRQRKSKVFGSMFLECFGVPWMEWFSDKALRAMFKDFESVNIEPYGFNIPKLWNNEVSGYNVFGHFHRIDVIK